MATRTRSTRGRSMQNGVAPHARPVYELRMRGHGGGDMELAIWQLPSVATPRLREPEWTAALKGRPLRLVETRVLKLLKAAGVRSPKLRKGDTERASIDEDVAMNLALLFRTLAPMRSVERIEQVAAGVERMSPEEAAYWLGMTIHRKQPRRVLAALRMLLTAP